MADEKLIIGKVDISHGIDHALSVLLHGIYALASREKMIENINKSPKESDKLLDKI